MERVIVIVIMPTRHSKESATDTNDKDTADVLMSIARTVRNSTEKPSSFEKGTNLHSNSDEIQNTDIDNQSGNEKDINQTDANDSSDDESRNDQDNNVAEVHHNDGNPSVFGINLSTLSKDEFPHIFQYYKDKTYPEVIGTKHNSNDQLSTMSFLVHLRGLVYNRNKNSGKEQKPHKNGYRFPLNDLITEKDCPQMKYLANKFYKNKKERNPHLWFYYFPSTADVTHHHLTNFLKYNFPSEFFHLSKR